ncbi:sialidase family protein [Dactylosporangium sp. NPDC000244]|uniref:sialidase family protein n=1 Tax=Dactylosporangium sp. NPDC000244 TaxID=3154365 RepID=UPI0033230AE4
MPEQPVRDELASRLRAERDRLDIEQPPMEVIAARAAALRRRRLAARTGAAAIAALVAAGVGAVALDRRDHPAPTAAASDPAAVWSADGITITGLPHLPADLPGTVRDAEFLDADHGFLLTADGSGTWISRTADGGRSWSTVRSPIAGRPELITIPGGAVLVGPGPAHPRAATSDGVQWNTDNAPVGPAAPLTGNSRLIALAGDACGAPTGSITKTDLAPVPQQPPLAVCWRSRVQAGDGSWWVGGRAADGSPAVAVSRDGGVSWEPHVFPGFPANASARAAMLGRTVFAAIVAPQEAAATPERLLAVATSTDGGASFEAPHPTAGQATIGGDLVPLSDGRLLIVDGYGHWLVSEDGGASWVRLEGLHQTMRLARTEAGYVAYQMTTIYTAFSVDGVTWQKLDAQ